MLEFRADDLRFTLEETEEFLTQAMELPLDHDAVAALETRTEGWVAGLQLAALAMRDRSDLAGFVAGFTGSNRFIMDYLADEVLQRQPESIQRFLLHTSVLRRMCASLCHALLGGESWNVADAECQSILEQLDRANLFVVPLDDERRWYRYHHLFREVLNRRLQLVAPHMVLTLQRGAREWFEAERLVDEAIHCALAVEDWDAAVTLIEHHAYAIGKRGHVQTVLGWLSRLPKPPGRQRPLLLAIEAIMLMFDNQLQAAKARLADAQASTGADTPEDEVVMVRALSAVAPGSMAFMRGEIGLCIGLAKSALRLLPEVEPGTFRVRPIAMMLASMAYQQTGDAGADAERAASEPLELLRAAGDLFGYAVTATNLAQLRMTQGRLREAIATLAEAAGVLGVRPGLDSLFGGAAYQFQFAELLRERNELEEAARYVARGMNVVQGTVTVPAGAIVGGYITSARLLEAFGNAEGAIASLNGFKRLAEQGSFAGHLVAQVEATQIDVVLRSAAGRAPAPETLARADRWSEATGLRANDDIEYQREPEYFTLARVLLARGGDEPFRIREAVGLLDRLREAADAGGRTGSAIQILVLKALALDTQGEASEALAALQAALVLADAEGYVRVFVDEGPPMKELLRRAWGRGVAQPYVARLLGAFDGPRRSSGTAEGSGERIRLAQNAALAEMLTARELEVLRLIAGGASNRDIARVLVISLGTVKKHTNNIFGKLGISSRTQAVARGRALDLL